MPSSHCLRTPALALEQGRVVRCLKAKVYNNNLSKKISLSKERIRRFSLLKTIAKIGVDAVAEPKNLELKTTETTTTEEENEDSMMISVTPPSVEQVKTLVKTICEETEIRQVLLKYGSFKMSFKRSMGENMTIVSNEGIIEQQHENHQVTMENQEMMVINNENAMNEEMKSLKMKEYIKSPMLEDSFSEEEMMQSIDESLIYIDSSKVGYFRRGLYNKTGKKIGPGPKIGEEISKGQVMCAIEQLGTFTPIVAPQQGEILNFPIEDGKPVQFRETVIEFAPYFGGHIIGDNLNA